MARSPFSLYKRVLTSSKNVYYIQFRDPETLRYLPGKSSERLAYLLHLDPREFPSSSKTGARKIAYAWLQSGCSVTYNRMPELGQYCLQFWDWDSSEYIKNKRTRNERIGKDYVTTCHGYIDHHLITDQLSHVRINVITTGLLERFIYRLREEKKLGNKTCNEILGCIRKALNEAERTGLISENKAKACKGFENSHRIKGLLTTDEIKKLFASTWSDERTRIACELSFLTGMRLGEIIALKKSEIHDSTLVIKSSYSKLDKLKCTKNGHERSVYLPEFLRKKMISLANQNTREDGYVFWSEKVDEPMNASTITKNLYFQLSVIGIPDIRVPDGAPEVKGSRQERNISFHSFRHLYNTLMRYSVSDEVLRLSTGHLTPEMTERYDHPEHDVRIKETGEVVEKRLMSLIYSKAD